MTERLQISSNSNHSQALSSHNNYQRLCVHVCDVWQAS